MAQGRYNDAHFITSSRVYSDPVFGFFSSLFVSKIVRIVHSLYIVLFLDSDYYLTAIPRETTSKFQS